MELRLAGHNPDKHTPEMWDVMSIGMMRREEIRYMELTVLISAVLTAGKLAAGGDPGDSLRNALQTYRGVLFPEIKSDLLAKAKQNEKILEQEFAKGPMKAQSLNYKKRGKKR